MNYLKQLLLGEIEGMFFWIVGTAMLLFGMAISDFADYLFKRLWNKKISR